MRRLLDTFALAAAIAGLAILVTFCAATADAHTDQDLQAEVARLEAALAATPGPAGLNYAHREALADLRRRHPCRQAAGTACAAPSRPAAAHQATTRPTGTPTAGVEQWRPLVAAHFGAYTDEALRVIACESGGKPRRLQPERSLRPLPGPRLLGRQLRDHPRRPLRPRHQRPHRPRPLRRRSQPREPLGPLGV